MAHEFAQLVVNGLITGSILALGAVGASLLFGVLKIGNFAHGDYMSLGAYVALFFNLHVGLNLVVAGLLGLIGVAAFAVALEFALFRPLRGAGPTTIFIVTIGLALALRHIIYLIAGARSYGYTINQARVFVVLGLRLSPGQLIVLVTAAVVISLVALFLARTRLGKSMRALADNPNLAAVAGVDVDRIAVFTWLLAGALAGLAGILLGVLQATFTPELGWSVLFLIFTSVILGGIGSPYGALVAGLALGLAMEISTWSGFAGGLEPKFKPVLAFAMLITLLLCRPQGLLGKARVL